MPSRRTFARKPPEHVAHRTNVWQDRSQQRYPRHRQEETLMSTNETAPNLDDVLNGDTVTITREGATVTDTVFDIPLPGVLDLSHFDDRFDVGPDAWTLTAHRRSDTSTRRIVVDALAKSLGDNVDYEALYDAADAVTAALNEAAS